VAVGLDLYRSRRPRMTTKAKSKENRKETTKLVRKVTTQVQTKRQSEEQSLTVRNPWEVLGIKTELLCREHCQLQLLRR
jgi:hypothetical protein